MVSDQRKIGLVSDYVTVPANSIHTLVTDWLPDRDYIREFENLGIKVIQTNPRG